MLPVSRPAYALPTGARALLCVGIRPAECRHLVGRWLSRAWQKGEKGSHFGGGSVVTGGEPALTVSRRR